ncbi:outer membrane beta-barrel protein [Flavobacterium cerinum]|uniref:TonB-dependent receptor n=1 Tax=Flavobacterium cerinum TaxID=2502784 RepID=A0ABY5ISH9_9FLAO|nr:outer membrane beta-barrel protein [Flavobacterium cerinum]UUC45230.1 TonB-dependent receptor [Flavobacterium cerinum]
MRKIYLLIFVLLSQYSLYAQESPTTITGKVVSDSLPVAFANVVLLDWESKKVVTGVTTDNDGSFSFAVTPGTYSIKTSFLGYQNYESAIIKAESGVIHKLPLINLKEDGKLLNEVVIETTTKKPLIQLQSDKIVMNVENSVLSEGNTALELLEKAPGVMVDNDGNISLRGKQGVTIMINDKKTYLSQQQLTNLLKGTSSSSISAVEVITNPSAKYDAAGNAGVINIKLKKNARNGFNGSVNANYGRGRKNRFGSGLNLNYKTGKYNFYGSYDQYYRGESETFTFERNFYTDANRQTIDKVSNQYSVTDEPLKTNNFKAGLEYDLSERTFLGFKVNGSIGSYTNNSMSENKVRSSDNSLLSDALTNNHNYSKWNSMSYNGSFLHKFDQEKQEISADVDYTHSRFRDNALLDTQFNQTPVQDAYQSTRRGMTPSGTNIFVAKADYVYRVKENLSFEAGWKSSFVKSDNDVQYDTISGGNWIIDRGTTNHFIYKEQIHAGYINYKQNFGFIDVQAGLRAEHTAAEGNQVTMNSVVKRNYTQLFPSLFLKKNIGEEHVVQLSYSRRIDRPDYYDLNPFRFFRDPFIFYEGNPYLQPELTHSVEWGYSFRNKHMINFFYSTTSDVIVDAITQIDDTNTTILRSENLSTRKNYGVSLTSGIKLTRWWDANNFVNLYRNEFSGEQNESSVATGIWSYDLNSQHSLKLSKGLTSEFSFQYNSRSIYSTFERKDFFVVSAGIQKKLFSDKATVKLAVNDIFKSRRFYRTMLFNNINMKENINLDSRILNVSFTYNFGDQNQNKRKINIEDDETKKRMKN